MTYEAPPTVRARKQEIPTEGLEELRPDRYACEFPTFKDRLTVNPDLGELDEGLRRYFKRTRERKLRFLANKRALEQEAEKLLDKGWQEDLAPETKRRPQRVSVCMAAISLRR
jgi:phytoene dehydrogenase-like protein